MGMQLGSVDYGTDLFDANTGASQSGGNLNQGIWNPDNNPYLFGQTAINDAWGGTNLLTGQVDQTGGPPGGGFYVTPPSPPTNLGEPPGWNPVPQYPEYGYPPPQAPPQTNVLNYSPTSALDLGSTFQPLAPPVAALGSIANMGTPGAPQGPAAMNMQQPQSQFAPLAGYNPGSGGGGGGARSPLDVFGAMARGGAGPGMMTGGGMAPPAPSGPGPQVQQGQGSGPNPMSDMSGGLSRMMGSQAPGAAPLQGNVSMGQSAPPSVGGVGGGGAPPGTPQPNMPPTSAPSANVAQGYSPGSVIASAPGEEDNTQGESAGSMGSLDDLQKQSGGPSNNAPEGEPLSSEKLLREAIQENRNTSKEGFEIAKRHADNFADKKKLIEGLQATAIAGPQETLKGALAKMKELADPKEMTPEQVETDAQNAHQKAWAQLDASSRNLIRSHYPTAGPMNDPYKDLDNGGGRPDADGIRPFTDQGRRPPYQGNAYGQPAPAPQRSLGQSVMHWARGAGARAQAARGNPAALNAMNAQAVARYNAQQKQAEENQKERFQADQFSAQDAKEARATYDARVAAISDKADTARNTHFNQMAKIADDARKQYEDAKKAQDKAIKEAYDQEKEHAANEFKALNAQGRSAGHVASIGRTVANTGHQKVMEKVAQTNAGFHGIQAGAQASQAETASRREARLKAGVPEMTAVHASQVAANYGRAAMGATGVAKDVAQRMANYVTKHPDVAANPAKLKAFEQAFRDSSPATGG